MKKIVLILLAGALALSAVDWEVQQVTDDPALVEAHDPILAVDDDGYARVLFIQSTGDYILQLDLKVASNATGWWVVSQVARLTQDSLVVYGLDVDKNGKTFVVFADYQDGQFDIFFAADTGGEFVPVNLTNSPDIQIDPVLKLDNEGTPHLIFQEESGAQTRLVYGWLDQEGLHPQVVNADFVAGPADYDLVLDFSNLPHILYTDQYLWYACTQDLSWEIEQLNDEYSENPSAVIDDSSNLHVVYHLGLGLHCFSQTNEGWKDTLVMGSIFPDYWWFRASLDIDMEGNLHGAWIYGSMTPITADDIHYGSNISGIWTDEKVTDTWDLTEEPGYGHYFALDREGYGHIVWAADDHNEVKQVYYAKTKEPLTGVAEQPVSANSFNLEIRSAMILFSLSKASSIRLDLYDASGRRVERLASGTYGAGEHVVPINTTKLVAGVYFARIEAGRLSASVKFVLTH